MQLLKPMFGCLWIVWTVVEASSAQSYGYRSPFPNIESIRPHRPVWGAPLNSFPERPTPPKFFPPPHPAIHAQPGPIYRPFAPNRLNQLPVPAQRLPNFNNFRKVPPPPARHVPPLYVAAPPASPPAIRPRHIYWFRPARQLFRVPPPPPKSPPTPSFPLHVPLPPPRSPARPPFASDDYGYLKNTAKISKNRVFTALALKNPRRIFIGQPTELSTKSPESYGEGLKNGDEVPREEPTTVSTDLEMVESQAILSPRHRRKSFHGNADYAATFNSDFTSEGGCDGDLSCRTAYHCAVLGGRPTFLPCGVSPTFYCCDLSISSLVDSSKNRTSRSDPQCGWSRERTNRVVGGYDADFGEIPWQAFIKVGESLCGGALLNRHHVLTAAHCVNGKKSGKIEVLLGELVLKQMVEELPHERRRVARVIIHPDYEDLNIDAYDVAILVLDRPVDYQPNIMPICLPEPDEAFTGTLATVSGWGRFFADHDAKAIHLQSVQVPVIDNMLCRKWLRSRGKYASINADHVCAGYEEGGRDSCRGDSGGPLTYQKNGRWYLVGVVSAGYGCGKPRQPGIYHRISHTVEWISTNVFA